jgi:hypothetical protein
MRVVVAKVLSAAANTVLVAQHPLKLGAHLTTALEHDGVKMRVAVAKVLSVAANTVLVAQHLLKLGAHLTTALASLQVRSLARRSSLEVGSTQEKKGAESIKM